MAFPTGWSGKQKLTIDNTKVSGTANLTNMPVLVKDGNFISALYSGAKSDGSDLRFTSDSAGTTELPFEIVSFTPGSSLAEVWVKIPTVTYNSDKVFYAWYGNASATAYAATDTYGSQNVWDSNYKIVHHFQGSAGSTNKKLNNEGTSTYDLTEVNTPSSITGKVSGADGAYSFDDASSEYLTFADTSLPTAAPRTFSGWIKTSDTTNLGNIWSYGTRSSNALWSVVMGDSSTSNQGKLVFTQYGGAIVGTNVIDDGVWHYIVVVNNTGNNIKMYLDGSSESVTGSATISTSLNSGAISANQAAGEFLNCILDEIRFSTTERTADWIATEYNNQNSPSTFITGTAVSTAYTLTMAVGSLTLTGIATTLTTLYNLVLSAGSYVLTGIATTFSRVLILTIAVGSFILTGIDVILNKMITLSLTAGSYALTGIAVAFKIGMGIVLSAGNYALTGMNILFKKTGWSNQSKNSTSYTNKSKNSTSYTNKTKNSTIWTNENKN